MYAMLACNNGAMHGVPLQLRPSQLIVVLLLNCPFLVMICSNSNILMLEMLCLPVTKIYNLKDEQCQDYGILQVFKS